MRSGETEDNDRFDQEELPGLEAVVEAVVEAEVVEEVGVMEETVMIRLRHIPQEILIRQESLPAHKAQRPR